MHVSEFQVCGSYGMLDNMCDSKVLPTFYNMSIRHGVKAKGYGYSLFQQAVYESYLYAAMNVGSPHWSFPT